MDGILEIERRGMQCYLPASNEIQLLIELLNGMRQPPSRDGLQSVCRSAKQIVSQYFSDSFSSNSSSAVYKLERGRFIAEFLARRHYAALLDRFLRAASAINKSSLLTLCKDATSALQKLTRHLVEPPSALRHALALIGPVKAWVKCLDMAPVLNPEREQCLELIYFLSLSSANQRILRENQAIFKKCALHQEEKTDNRLRSLIILIKVSGSHAAPVVSSKLTQRLIHRLLESVSSGLHSLLLTLIDRTSRTFRPQDLVEALLVQCQNDQQRIVVVEEHGVSALCKTLQYKCTARTKAAAVSVLEMLAQEEHGADHIMSHIDSMRELSLPDSLQQRVTSLIEKVLKRDLLQRLSEDEVALMLLRMTKECVSEPLLVRRLQRLDPDRIRRAVTATYLKRTCLLQAARDGRCALLLFYVGELRVPCDTRGSFVAHGKDIEDATALWVAAGYGQTKAVQLLLGLGASVSVCCDELSVLHHSCSSGNMDTVQLLLSAGADPALPGPLGSTCLMLSAVQGKTSLIKCFLDKDPKGIDCVNRLGRTALHEASKVGSLPVVELLVSQNARYQADFSGMTPALLSALHSQRAVCEFFMHSKAVSSKEKIHILELRGALYFLEYGDPEKGLTLWKSALKLRTTAQHYIELDCKPEAPSFHIFKGKREYRTETELDEITDLEDLQTQALLTLHRVLGPTAPWLLDFLRQTGALAHRQNQLLTCHAYWHTALTAMCDFPGIPETTSDCLVCFVRVCEVILQVQTLRELRLVYNIMQHVALNAMWCGNPYKYLPRHWSTATSALLAALCCLFSLLVQNRTALERSVWIELQQHLHHLVRTQPADTSGRSLLHYACCADTPSQLKDEVANVLQFPSPGIVRMLLELGANVDAADNCGETPLHVAGHAHAHGQQCYETCRLLIASGAHWDIYSDDGMPFWSPDGIVVRELLDTAPQVAPLVCLCARQVAKHFRSEYLAETLGEQLHQTVTMHGAQ